MESKATIYVQLICLILVSVCALLWLLGTLSISYNEAMVFFSKESAASLLGNLGVNIFGQNDFGLRVPFLLLHICNTCLMFILAQSSLKLRSDAIFCTALFCLLPGVNAVALLVNNAGIVIFFTLILCIFVQKYNKIPYPLLFIMALVDKSFVLVFLALIFYGISSKNTLLILTSLFCFALNMYAYGLDISGHPSGHFLDNNAHLMLIFSPLVFLYFLYCLYRYFNAQEKPLTWYIAICSLFFIWLVSLRQRVQIETFAPVLLVALPIMMKLYFSGLRVRLPQFRTRYKLPFSIAFFTLVLLSGTLFLSKPLFLLFSNANEHFAHRHFIAKELAISLKNRGIYAVQTNNNLQMRLKFYGIKRGGSALNEVRKADSTSIPIIYYGKIVAIYYLQ